MIRERVPTDRRGVRIRFRRERMAEVLRLYAGMDRSMREICAGYEEDELALIAGFLRRTSEAGRRASEDLAGP